MYPVYGMRWQYKHNQLSEVMAIAPNGMLRLYASAEDILGDEFVLMQFTGVVDKNGKEIYEGDILRHETGCVLVGWSNLHNAWVYAGEDVLPYEISGGKLNACEIVGNRYQNPDLLTWETWL